MRALGLMLGLLLATPASAATIVLDFEEEKVGTDRNHFASAEWDGVMFSEERGTYLLFYPWRDEGNVMWVGDEGGRLHLDFAVPVLSITIDFGDSGDNAEYWRPPTLVGFLDGIATADATTQPTMNNLADESLTITGLFDAASFRFTQLGEYEPESPMVTRIILETATVPEPATVLLLLGGVALNRVASRRARRR